MQEDIHTENQKTEHVKKLLEQKEEFFQEQEKKHQDLLNRIQIQASVKSSLEEQLRRTEAASLDSSRNYDLQSLKSPREIKEFNQVALEKEKNELNEKIKKLQKEFNEKN